MTSSLPVYGTFNTFNQDRIAECPNKGNGSGSSNKGFDPRSGTGEPVKVCCGPPGLR